MMMLQQSLLPTLLIMVFICGLQTLQSDAWTSKTSGCQCKFDTSRTDCACCEEGGCQCLESNPHQCVECGDLATCDKPDQNDTVKENQNAPKDSPKISKQDKIETAQRDDKIKKDPFTKSATGCACPDNPSDLSCACCQQNACQCGVLQPNKCVQCGFKEHHCGSKPKV